MAVNYFGKRRLEKIFFNYISDRKDLTKAVRADFRKYGKEQVISYRKFKGLEWFEINNVYDEYSDKLICYKIHTVTSDKGCRVSMSEQHINEDDNDENSTKKEVFYGHAYYTEDFYPYAGETKLRCREVCKTSLTGETVTVYQTEDGEHFSLEPVANNGRYISEYEHKGNIYKCELPPVFYVGLSGGRKCLFMKDSDADVHIRKNKDGLPYIEFFQKNQCDYDNFLKTEKSEKIFYFYCKRAFPDDCLVSDFEEEGEFSSPCYYCAYYLDCQNCELSEICNRTEKCREEKDRLENEKIMTLKELEKSYEENGCNDYQLKTLDDLKAIHGIDVSEISGYQELSDKHRELFNKTVIRFFNAWGLENRKELKPESIHYVCEVNYEKETDDGMWAMNVCTEVYLADNDGNITKRRIYRQVSEKGVRLKKCKKYITKYLQFELKNKWYHIKENGEWY